MALRQKNLSMVRLIANIFAVRRYGEAIAQYELRAVLGDVQG
jgi:hypothetical protein